MMSTETAMKNLSLKEEFLTRFLQKSNVRPGCLFKRLRVTYDYTQHKEIDAVILTSQKILLLELVTWSGRYHKESDKEWIREEKVEGVASHTLTTNREDTENAENTIVTVMSTKVSNPVNVARDKLKALKQYIESKIGPRSISDFDFYVLFIKEECSLTEDCLNPRIVPYSQLDRFAEWFLIGWGRWLLEWYPMWPVWLRGYNYIKSSLETIPTYDVVYLKTGTKLYGELRSCTGLPYDRQNTSVLHFTTKKAGLVFGSNHIKGTTIERATCKTQADVTLDIASKLEFICVDADSTTSINLTDIDKVVLSIPLS